MNNQHNDPGQSSYPSGGHGQPSGGFGQQSGPAFFEQSGPYPAADHTSGGSMGMTGADNQAVADIFKQRSEQQASSDAKVSLALGIFVLFAAVAAFLLYMTVSSAPQAEENLDASLAQQAAEAAGNAGVQSTAGMDPAMMASGAGATTDAMLADAEQLFYQGKLTQARDAAARIPAGDPRGEELRTAIQAMADANDFFIAKDVFMASRSINRVPPIYADVPTVAGARETIDAAKEEVANGYFRQAKSHFRDGRYEAARRLYEEVLMLSPSHDEALDMSEASRLAKNATTALGRIYPLLRAEEHVTAERLANEARADFDNSKRPGAVRMMADLKSELDDCYYYARMLDLYHNAGDAQGAIEMLAQLSPKFVYDNQLDGRAKTIQQVGEAAAIARSTRSIEHAQLVLGMEGNPKNVLRREMEDLVNELETAVNNRAESLVSAGRDAKKRGDLAKALAMFLEARRVDPEFREAKNLHKSLANDILVTVHRLGVEGDENLPQREALLQIVLDNSLESDPVYNQAVSKLSDVQDEMKRVERERR